MLRRGMLGAPGSANTSLKAANERLPGASHLQLHVRPLASMALVGLAACTHEPAPVNGTLFGVSRTRCLLGFLAGGDLRGSTLTECIPDTPLEARAGRTTDGWFVAFTDPGTSQHRVADPTGRLLVEDGASSTVFASVGGHWFGASLRAVEAVDSTPPRAQLTATSGTSYLDLTSVGDSLLVLQKDVAGAVSLHEHQVSGDTLGAGRVLELPLLAAAVRIAESDASSVLLTEPGRGLWARVALDGSTTGTWVAGTGACLGGNALHVFSKRLLERFADGVSSQARLSEDTTGVLCTCDRDRVLLLRGGSVFSFDWRTQRETAMPSDVQLTHGMLLRCAER